MALKQKTELPKKLSEPPEEVVGRIARTYERIFLGTPVLKGPGPAEKGRNPRKRLRTPARPIKTTEELRIERHYNTMPKEELEEIMKTEERNNLITLGTIVRITDTRNLSVGLLGGLLIRAYSPKWTMRHTHDLDFSAKTDEKGEIKSMMMGLDYSEDKHRTRFGLAFVKSSETERGRKVKHKVHFSLDFIYDSTTNMFYVFKDYYFKKKRIPAYFDENRDYECYAYVMDLEDALLMKLMTRREKDWNDALVLIIEAFDEMDMDSITESSFIQTT